MPYSFVLNQEIREDGLAPCYVFYGEETYLAEQFVQQVRELLLEPEAQSFNVERFELPGTSWAEVLDVARTAPFLFASRRIVLANARGDAEEKLPRADQELIKAYCQSPPQKTILVVIISGRVRKSHPLVKAFTSSGSGAVGTEIRPLYERDLALWINKRLEGSAKVLTSEAVTKLIEIVGSDLRRIDRELDKVLTFAADRRVIDVQDVLDICGWGRSFAEWDLTDSLEQGDYHQSLVILNRRFEEGVKAENLLGSIAGLLRDVLLAKLWLDENRDRKEIFAALRPKIQEGWTLYQGKFRAFFGAVEALSKADLNSLIARLKDIDSLVKSSDTPAQAMLEGFIFEYCRLRRRPAAGKRLTSRGRG